jgi:ATP-dependent DNA helicase RecG
MSEPLTDNRNAETSLQQVPVTQLRGVGPALASKLAALGIHSIQDLLFHLPLRYEDRTRITPMRRLQLGSHVLLQGEVISSAIQFGRRRSLQVTLSDQSGFIAMRLFHFSAAQKNSLVPGALIRCFGEVRMGRSGFELYHPEYRLLQDPDEPVDASLTPIYPTTDGLAQLRLRSILSQAVALLKRSGIEDLLPVSLCQRYGFDSLPQALLELHEPKPTAGEDMQLGDSSPGAKRLAFEELLAHRLCLRRNRVEGNRRQAPAFV